MVLGLQLPPVSCSASRAVLLTVEQILSTLLSADTRQLAELSHALNSGMSYRARGELKPAYPKDLRRQQLWMYVRQVYPLMHDYARGMAVAFLFSRSIQRRARLHRNATAIQHGLS